MTDVSPEASFSYEQLFPWNSEGTFVGICLKDVVILGADTSATASDIISKKNCESIHFLRANICACGARIDAVTRRLLSQLKLHCLNTAQVVPVVEAVRIVKQNYQENAMIIGGVDNSGSHLYSIAPSGCSSKEPYLALGSGSFAAYACLEVKWRDDMTVEEGTKLAIDAISSGILNDLRSGNNIDICTITKTSVDIKRGYDEARVKGKKIGNYLFKTGTTAVLSEQEILFDV